MLLNTRLFFAQFATLLLVGIVDVYADINHWYWQYRWLDTPVHFMAGVWVALCVVWLSHVVRRPLRGVVPIVALVFAVGIAWELYDYVFIIVYTDYYPFDTVKDLLMDVLGGLVGYSLAQRLAPQSAEPTHE